MTPLERRYRRLLAAYPWTHRRQYEEEMLAVLLAGSAPGQRRPDLRDTVDVLAAAAWLRLRNVPHVLRTPAWSAGAAVTGLLASLALLAYATGRSAYLVAGWAAVSLCALLGRRRPAAGLAWLSAGGQVVLFIHAYGQWPVIGVDSAWTVVLAMVAASALTVAGSGALAVLGRRRLLAFGAALGLLLAVSLVNRLTAPGHLVPSQYTVHVTGQYETRSVWALDAMLAADAIGWLALAIAVVGLAPPVRRRLVVSLVPVAVPFLVDRLTLAGWKASTDDLGHAIPLVPAQWLALFGLPVLVGVAGAAYLQRREHILHLVELGRSAVDGV
jgi:hypothetical protein